MPRARSGEKPAKGRSPAKRIDFGDVDIIPQRAPPAGPPKPMAPAKEVPRMYKLRRSPTPLLGLDNIDLMTKEHLAQLNSVWKEGDLPAFEADSRRIAATMASLSSKKGDPFE